MTLSLWWGIVLWWVLDPRMLSSSVLSNVARTWYLHYILYIVCVFNRIGLLHCAFILIDNIVLIGCIIINIELVVFIIINYMMRKITSLRRSSVVATWWIQYLLSFTLFYAATDNSLLCDCWSCWIREFLLRHVSISA